MKYNALLVEKHEFTIVSALLHPISDSDNMMNKCAVKLKQELKTAILVDDSEFPYDVVRLNSKVEVETDGRIKRIQLVLPQDANSINNKISLLTPMGTALFGYAVGDCVRWIFPVGEKQIFIRSVEH